MNLKNILSVSGEPGLYELVDSKSNGVVLRNPLTGKVKFYSVRLHQFTPLETIGIYTDSDTAELSDIFTKMRAQENALPIPNIKDSNNKIMDYFVQIVPDYDTDRVYASDIKKVIKWYNAMKECGFLDRSDDSEE
ncbi:MAG TPA: DUF5606 domain-containing protein [Saprospiraceae bacterium]|nr:DUF5606 domain-containing protein [Saprospiraceae bacterium]